MTVSSAGQFSWLRNVCVWSLACVIASPVVWAQSDDETAPHRRPVKVIAPERIKIKTAQGEAIVPVYSSADLSKIQSAIKRVVIMTHGRLRDADKYFDLTLRAAKASNAMGDTLLIAPQFLTTADAARHNLEPAIARWKSETWLSGDMSKTPFSLSSFDVLDGIIAQLADRARFPNLERIVVAGHSGGAQFVQRYAVVGRADQVLTAAGLQPYAEGVDPSTLSAGKGPVMLVRYVVANPSSYVYFDATRPASTNNCQEFDHWRYGMVDPVSYARVGDAKAMERRYLTRRVIYLLGGKDSDPNHSALDLTCMAEAQGANRLERGNNYFAHVLKRAKLQNISPRQTRVEVPDVAHDASRIFNSICGKAALFDAPGCEMKMGESMTAPATAASPSAAAVGAIVPVTTSSRWSVLSKH